MNVSIALATFNGERFLDEQLASLASQTRLPDELVVCDDRSTDRTRAIVRDFAREAPFSVYLYENNHRLGFAENFLKAAKLCRGDVIAFCDQDDVWLPHKVECCAAQFEDPDVRLVMHSSLLVDETLRPSGKRIPAVSRTRKASPLHVDPWFFPVLGNSMLFTAHLLRLDPGNPRPRSQWNREMGHDQWIYFLANVVGKSVFLSRVHALYRQHPGSVGARMRQADELHWLGEPQARGWRIGRYQFLSELASEYAAFLRELGNRASPLDARAEFDAAVLFYDAVADLWERRVVLYEADRAATRLRNFATLLAARGYKRRSVGGLGARGLLRDVAYVAAGRTW